MTEIITKTYIPQGFTEAPTTVKEALQQARELLAEEGRWCRTKWYDIEEPYLDPDTPFCDSWHVCAEGAVAMVTLGSVRFDTLPFNDNGDLWFDNERGERVRMPVSDFPENTVWAFRPEFIHAFNLDASLYHAALEVLKQAGLKKWYDAALPAASRVAPYHFNDDIALCRTRDDVDAWFELAIEIAEDV